MTSLDRKLFRDLWHARGQVIAIALVVACGIASFVMARSAYTSLTLTQNTYYNEYHFAQVFTSLKRAPETLKATDCRYTRGSTNPDPHCGRCYPRYS